MWRRNHRRGARLQARRRRGQNLPGSTAAHGTRGETFTFESDDHLWVFINGKLPLDLAGLHAKATGSVNLDAQARCPRHHARQQLQARAVPRLARRGRVTFPHRRHAQIHAVRRDRREVRRSFASQNKKRSARRRRTNSSSTASAVPATWRGSRPCPQLISLGSGRPPRRTFRSRSGGALGAGLRPSRAPCGRRRASTRPHGARTDPCDREQGRRPR